MVCHGLYTGTEAESESDKGEDSRGVGAPGRTG